MKKRRLKRWVKNLLVGILVLSIIIGSSECENMTIFVVSHIIAGITMILSGYILIKNMEE